MDLDATAKKRVDEDNFLELLKTYPLGDIVPEGLRHCANMVLSCPAQTWFPAYYDTTELIIGDAELIPSVGLPE
jgi:hypothetical protein